jgi:transcriptional regulator with XRE-family HTH domain
MPEGGSPRGLGARLRELRTGWSITQRQLSDALNLSGALVSSWEKGTATPPEGRLDGYARFFATRRSLAGKQPALVPDLSPEEEAVRSSLLDELLRMREETLDRPHTQYRETGELGGRFWYFPDGQPVTILCTPLSAAQLGFKVPGGDGLAGLPPAVQYATNPTHPNAVRNLANGDVDSLLELVGHIRAENPTADVRWLTYDRITNADQLTGHLVVLGGGDLMNTLLPDGEISTVRSLMDGLEIPVRTRFPGAGDEEFDGEFVVQVDDRGDPTYGAESEEVYKPRFVRNEGAEGRPRAIVRDAPQLRSDVALIVRKPNWLNPSATVTIMSGMFSRGTYGAVRAFTDAKFRSRNERWLESNLDQDDFWMLVQIPVIAGENTVTPDLDRASLILRTA